MELKKKFNIWMLVCMLLVTLLTGCGKNSQNADFLTGTWTLTGMKYDGDTYTKQDLTKKVILQLPSYLPQLYLSLKMYYYFFQNTSLLSLHK